MTSLELNVCKLNVHRLITAGVNGAVINAREDIKRMDDCEIAQMFNYESVTEEVQAQEFKNIMLSYLVELEDRLADALDI